MVYAAALLAISVSAVFAGTISGNVADYNAGQVKASNGVLTVPANVATYTATSTLAIGSTFVVTLPPGFTFGSAPTLTTSGTATFTLSGGGAGSQSATFTIATAAVTSGQTISLAGFTLHGATALETVTPVASALPLTMQAVGTDGAALSFKAFASDTGATAEFVGAILFIDVRPPSNATEFVQSPDSRQTVFSAFAFEAQTRDAVTGTVPILGSNGMANSLSNADKVTLTMHGEFGGIGKVFSSSNASCTNVLSYGTVHAQSVRFTNVAINVETFFCMIGDGGVLQANPHGYTAVTARPASGTTDFVSPRVNNEFPV